MAVSQHNVSVSFEGFSQAPGLGSSVEALVNFDVRVVANDQTALGSGCIDFRRAA